MVPNPTVCTGAGTRKARRRPGHQPEAKHSSTDSDLDEHILLQLDRQLEGVYTATTYWVTFTVTVVLNAIFLVAYLLRQIPRGHDGLLVRYLNYYFPFVPSEWTKRILG